MTTDDVLMKINQADALNVQPARGVYCTVCYKRAVHTVSIHKPYGDVIPLCEVHFDEVEQAVQERAGAKEV